ncbi:MULTISPECIES: restriction endonuclease [Catenuloplanes]|uniref:Restriction endonuclease type IV Mrr domain-containing protein n=1 Tax=Catenuloplanes niger TaxID=587534 RepID=A0AAE3ZQX7_9ACTN|nr:restriction endonuclease [Catenuloplanes niger]MDR7323447.1 hypothetical protein [Catenuloplanes niger]
MVSPDDAQVAPALDQNAALALERYQRSISRLTFCFDGRPTTLYNRTLIGRLSGSPRPVEILMWGPVMGEDVAVAIECRQRQQAVGVGAVEHFAGKLLDIAADCGILYSISGFTRNARARAAAIRSPAVMLLALNRPGRYRELTIPKQREPGEDEAFLPPHDAEEITELDFLLYLWLRPQSPN